MPLGELIGFDDDRLNIFIVHIDIDYTSIAIPSSIVRERENLLIMAEGSHEQAENPPNRGRAPTCNGSLN